MWQRFIDLFQSRRLCWSAARMFGVLAMGVSLGQSAQATVQLLPEMLLKREGQIIRDAQLIRSARNRPTHAPPEGRGR